MRFDSYHPIINFIYFVVVILCTCIFQHPFFIAAAYLTGFVWSIKLNGKRAARFNLFLIPCIILYTAWYASYHHFGVTNLWANRLGNFITWESIVVGFIRGVKAAAIIMEFSCIFATVTSDKIVYLFGSISPKLSLFFSILLRSVPRIKKQMKKIDEARKGLGGGIQQGNVCQRCCHLVGLLYITIIWTTEYFIESAASMKSRGYSLKGRKAFSIYRFDNRDRCFLTGMVCCIMITYIAHMMGQTMMYYNPIIIWEPITGKAIFYVIVYGIFLLLPFLIQVYGEWKFEMDRRMVD